MNLRCFKSFECFKSISNHSSYIIIFFPFQLHNLRENSSIEIHKSIWIWYYSYYDDNHVHLWVYKLPRWNFFGECYTCFFRCLLLVFRHPLVAHPCPEFCWCDFVLLQDLSLLLHGAPLVFRQSVLRWNLDVSKEANNPSTVAMKSVNILRTSYGDLVDEQAYMRDEQEQNLQRDIEEGSLFTLFHFHVKKAKEV